MLCGLGLLAPSQADDPNDPGAYSEAVSESEPSAFRAGTRVNTDSCLRGSSLFFSTSWVFSKWGRSHESANLSHIETSVLQLKLEVYIHLSQIHLNSVFHNS